MKTIPVATFNELSPALSLVERFDQVGVQATIRNESRLERLWFMSEPLAAIHVDVPQPDYLHARQLLNVWDTGNLMEMVHCPECGSSRVEFPQITRKFLMPVAQVVFMSLHLIPRQYYCEDCHFTWPKEKVVEPARDLLNFPVNSAIGMRPLHPSAISANTWNTSGRTEAEPFDWSTQLRFRAFRETAWQQAESTVNAMRAGLRSDAGLHSVSNSAPSANPPDRRSALLR